MVTQINNNINIHSAWDRTCVTIAVKQINISIQWHNNIVRMYSFISYISVAQDIPKEKRREYFYILNNPNIIIDLSLRDVQVIKHH